MPLLPGSDSKTISKNIGELVRMGHPQNQAAAIAFQHAGRSNRPDEPKPKGMNTFIPPYARKPKNGPPA